MKVSLTALSILFVASGCHCRGDGCHQALGAAIGVVTYGAVVGVAEVADAMPDDPADATAPIPGEPGEVRVRYPEGHLEPRDPDWASH